MKQTNKNSFLMSIAVACLFLVSKVSAQTVPQAAVASTHTIIETKSSGVQFSVFGDWGRGGNCSQTQVAQAMAKNGVGDFILTVGDNFQSEPIRSVKDPIWKSSFESVYKDSVLMCDWYPALGNQDYKGNGAAQVDYSKTSRRWKMAGRYYAVHKKIDSTAAVDFYIIDTSPFQSRYYKSTDHHVAGQDTAAQMRWLDSCLTNSRSRWKIVVGHHPLYSSGSGHPGEAKEMKKRFADFFDAQGVDAYFCGHDHDFEHIKPKSSKVNYFVCGTGSDVQPMKKPLKSTVFAQSVSGYVKVSMTAAAMKVSLIDTKGAIVYATEILKQF